MQIDVTVNMTLEVDDADYKSALEFAKEEAKDCSVDFDESEWLEGFMTDELEGEEIQTMYGRAWVCSVDDCSVL